MEEVLIIWLFLYQYQEKCYFFISMFVRTMSSGINADFLVIVEIILLKL